MKKVQMKLLKMLLISELEDSHSTKKRVCIPETEDPEVEIKNMLMKIVMKKKS